MYTMKEVCLETHMTYEALKYYCNENLIPDVQRDKNNHRLFDDHHIAWIKSLTCLKKCGMSIQEMKEYLALCLQGETTIPKRQIILDQKAKQLHQQIDEFNASLDYIAFKQQFYNDVLTGKTKYFGHLVKRIDETSTVD